VRFFIDECVSPSLSRHLNESGLHDAIHPRDRGRLRDSDRAVFAIAIREDRIIVTENWGDFRKLAASVELHNGLIILPSVARSDAQRAHGYSRCLPPRVRRGPSRGFAGERGSDDFGEREDPHRADAVEMSSLVGEAEAIQVSAAAHWTHSTCLFGWRHASRTR
jgi:predicted nuclease of predicted toxin-antitoxin system